MLYRTYDEVYRSVPFSSAFGNELREVPEPASREQLSRGFVAFRHPTGRYPHVDGLCLGVFGDHDYSLFHESLIRVLQSFFVNGFKVR